MIKSSLIVIVKASLTGERAVRDVGHCCWRPSWDAVVVHLRADPRYTKFHLCSAARLVSNAVLRDKHVTGIVAVDMAQRTQAYSQSIFASSRSDDQDSYVVRAAAHVWKTRRGIGE